MLESEIQTQILRWLKAEGIWHRRLALGPVKHGGVLKKNPMKGFPDLIAFLRLGTGRLVVIEVKTKKGKLSPEQEAVRLELETQGCLYILARSLDDVVSTFQHYERFGV